MQRPLNRFIDWWIRQNYWHYLWVPVGVSVLLAEAVVCAMSLLLMGRLDGGYLLTGLVASGSVSAAVSAAFFFLADRLRESEERYRLLIDTAAIPVILISAHEGRVLFANERATEYFAVPPGEAGNLQAREFWVHPAQRDEYVARLTREGRISGYEVELRTRRGETKWALLSANVTRVGHTPALFTVFLDITERRRQDEELRFVSEALKQCNEAIVLADRDHRFRYVNPAFSRLFGYSLDEVQGRPLTILETPDSPIHLHDFQGEGLRRAKDGRDVPVLLTISAVCDQRGEVMGHVGIMTDVTRMKEQQRQLETIAHFDILTGVPNRALLADRMRQAIAQTRRTGTLMAICYLDLDGFKPINDRYGHETGDRLLVEIAQRLRGCLREGDTVARLGGDEFVLILTGLGRVDESEATLRRVLDTISAPMSLADVAVTVSASIGVTFFPIDDAVPDTLLRHADQAMYRAKQGGRNRYHIFDSRLDA